MLSSTMKPAFNTPVSKFDPDGDPAENGKKLVQFEAAIRSSYRSSFAVCLDEKKFEALDQDTRSIYGQLLYDFLVVTTVGEALQIVLSAEEPDDGPASWRALQSHYGSSTDIHGAMILLGQLTAFQWEDNDNPALYATKLTKLERSLTAANNPQGELSIRHAYINGLKCGPTICQKFYERICTDAETPLSKIKSELSVYWRQRQTTTTTTTAAFAAVPVVNVPGAFATTSFVLAKDIDPAFATVCSLCTGLGHTKARCSSPAAMTRVAWCHHCGSRGHDYTECRSKNEDRGPGQRQRGERPQRREDRDRPPRRDERDHRPPRRDDREGRRGGRDDRRGDRPARGGRYQGRADVTYPTDGGAIFLAEPLTPTIPADGGRSLTELERCLSAENGQATPTPFAHFGTHATSAAHASSTARPRAPPPSYSEFVNAAPATCEASPQAAPRPRFTQTHTESVTPPIGYKDYLLAKYNDVLSYPKDHLWRLGRASYGLKYGFLNPNAQPLALAYARLARARMRLAIARALNTRLARARTRLAIARFDESTAAAEPANEDYMTNRELTELERCLSAKNGQATPTPFSHFGTHATSAAHASSTARPRAPPPPVVIMLLYVDDAIVAVFDNTAPASSTDDMTNRELTELERGLSIEHGQATPTPFAQAARPESHVVLAECVADSGSFTHLATSSLFEHATDIIDVREEIGSAGPEPCISTRRGTISALARLRGGGFGLLTLEDVRHAPAAQRSLFSLARVAASGADVHLDSEGGFINTRRQGAFLLGVDTHGLPKIELYAISSTTSINAALPRTFGQGLRPRTYDDWHAALGHAGPATISATLRALGLPSPRPDKQCNTCAVARSRRKAIPRSSRSTRTYTPGQVWFVDHQGPLRASIRGMKYVLVFINKRDSDEDSGCAEEHDDDAPDDQGSGRRGVSGAGISIVTASRRDYPRDLRKFLTLARARDIDVREIRSDNAPEYSSSEVIEILDRARIISTHWPPYTPARGGAVERRNGTLSASVRSMLLAPEAKGLEDYWCYAFEHATALYNSTVHPPATRPPIHDILPDHECDLTTIMAFGRDIAVHVHTATTKLAPRALPGRYLGMAPDHGPGAIRALVKSKVIVTAHYRALDYDKSGQGSTEAERASVQAERVSESAQAERASTQAERSASSPAERASVQAERVSESAQAERASSQAERSASSPAERASVQAERASTQTERSASSPAKALPMSVIDALVSKNVKLCVDQFNPKRGASAARYDLYKKATDAETFIILGGTKAKADLQNDILKGLVTIDGHHDYKQHPIVKGPVSTEPRILLTTVDDDVAKLHDDDNDLAPPDSKAGPPTKEPKTIKAAVTGPDAAAWITSIDDEIRALETTGTCTMVRFCDVEPGAEVLPSIAAFKIKTGEHGEITRHKTRIAADGSRQPTDSTSQSSPTFNFLSMMTVLSQAALHGWTIRQLDVDTAYLNAPIKQRIYVRFPYGFSDYLLAKNNGELPFNPKGHLWRLGRALYGLRQSGALWYDLVSTFIIGLGFQTCSSDACLFVRRKEGSIVTVLLYVDDAIVAGSPKSAVLEFEAEFADRFKVKLQGNARYVLGLNIRADPSMLTVEIRQSTYVRKILAEYGMENANPLPTPALANYAPSRPGTTHPALTSADAAFPFRQALGCLIWLMVTRPDITYVAGVLSQEANAPTHEGITTIKRTLHYLRGLPDVGIIFDGSQDPVLRVYVDASWANQTGSKSRTGVLITYLGGVLFSASKRQTIVALSTAEAELYALAYAVKITIIVRATLAFLGHDVLPPTPIYEDNEAVIAIIKKGAYTARTRHIALRLDFITDAINKGEIVVVGIATGEQLADFLVSMRAPARFTETRARILDG
jgi:hypothetical protein